MLFFTTRVTSILIFGNISVTFLKSIGPSIPVKYVSFQNWRIDYHGSFPYLRAKLKTRKIVFSEKDFERLWFLYKTEGEPKGVSINPSCISIMVKIRTSFMICWQIRMKAEANL